MNADSLAPLLAEDAVEELAQRRAAVEALAQVHALREAKRLVEKNIAEAEAPIRAFFQTHPDEQELHDAERGFKGRMQPRSKSVAYDTPAAIKQHDAKLYARLEELSALEIDPKRVTDAISRGQLSKGDIERYSHPRDGSPALLVQRKED